MLWVDQYRPKTLDNMDYHKPLSKQLKRLIAAGDFPHMLVYGPSGAGKKTRVMALLREMHGSSVERVKVEHRAFKFGSSAPIELTLLSSVHHIELNPSDAGVRDRDVVQELIKEIAQSAPVITGGESASNHFKVVVLNEVERLSRAAQHGLRRTMEKYVGTCRLLLCCTNPSKVIAPIRSRCICLRVAAPTHEEVCGVLASVAAKEGLKLPPALAARISKASDRNLRRALLALETCKVRPPLPSHFPPTRASRPSAGYAHAQVQQYPFSENQPVQLADWQLFLKETADDVIAEQSPKQLLKIRAKLYEVLSSCIPPELVMSTLIKALLPRVPQPVRVETLHFAAIYEHRMHGGQKPVFHLEAFLARFMAIYKRHAVNSFK